jgi:hydroxymethylpyrimidine pyrophosphatase-like HAD family hydrolase/orotate phosphoribosyltransferase
MSQKDCSSTSALTSPERTFRRSVLPSTLLETELNFYCQYPWALNVYPTVNDIKGYLQREITRLEEVSEEWQAHEVATNIFLLSCALTQAVDDYLLGNRLDFSKAVKAIPALTRVASVVETGFTCGQKARELRLRRLHHWRQRWSCAVIEFTRALQCEEASSKEVFAPSTALLTSLLSERLPSRLLTRRTRVPSAFHSQSLTPLDSQALARKFVSAFPDRQRPILVLGLRTAGSYFAPLVCAHLKREGYQKVDCVTARPTTGFSLWEAREIKRSARGSATVAIVDEPMTSGTTMVEAVRFLHRAGFKSRDIAALVPNHPARSGWTWSSKVKYLPATQITVLLLEGGEWHKRQLLRPEAVESRLQEYFLQRGYKSATLESGPELERYREQLRNLELQKGHIRFKNIYRVRLEDADGTAETRYVLAKSIGWGWLGYPAFLQAHRLSSCIPPVFGLRDGILYTEWIPEEVQLASETPSRSRLVDPLGSYVAARTRSLSLGLDPTADLAAQEEPTGLGLLSDPLSRAYHNKTTAGLKRGRLRDRLMRCGNPRPTLIDGRMQQIEWIRGPEGLLKTDFDHHGLGKPHLNAIDPAYDLAEAILYWDLSEEEESNLLDRYVEKSADAGVHQRLFLYKLLAGTWGTMQALEVLRLPHLSRQHAEYNRRFLQANNFQTMQTTRFCGSLCRHPRARNWHNPLVVLDIDGVLDAWIFEFPSTTAAGIKAVSLLHDHNFSVAVDTARSVTEVQEYCKAYGFVGGVAEYGSALWDAVRNREFVLVSSETLSELEKVKRALLEIPGAFVNDHYKYSIRAYRFEEERPGPLPTSLVQDVLTRLDVKLLKIHQTSSDTAILGKEIDKGTGLHALLAWTGTPNLDTVAIGDSDADLAMFRVAKRSFAPAQIKCREEAQAVGCQIAGSSYQEGLLEIVQMLIHAGGERCERCQPTGRLWTRGKDLFLDLLEIADKRDKSMLLRALLDPMALRVFMK